MSDEPQAPENEAADEVSPLTYPLAVVILVLPVLGILFHGFIFLTAPEWSNDYLHGLGLKVVAVIAFANLVGNWFHYRNTRMTLDVFSRILTYLWILTIVLLVVHWRP